MKNAVKFCKKFFVAKQYDQLADKGLQNLDCMKILGTEIPSFLLVVTLLMYSLLISSKPFEMKRLETNSKRRNSISIKYHFLQDDRWIESYFRHSPFVK